MSKISLSAFADELTKISAISVEKTFNAMRDLAKKDPARAAGHIARLRKKSKLFPEWLSDSARVRRLQDVGVGKHGHEYERSLLANAGEHALRHGG